MTRDTSHKRHRARTRWLLGAGAIVSLSGCFKLARPTPPLEEYVLGGGGPARTAVPRDTGAVTIGLRRLDLAPYLATTAIVVRHGSQISTSGFRRWAEEPSAGIARAVAGYLSAGPSVRAVDVAPWAARAEHDYLVQLHVTNLEGVAPADSSATTGAVHLATSWEIIRAKDGVMLARGKSDRRENGWSIGDYRGLVSRIELELDGLAGDLTACLARLSPVVPPVGVAEVVRPLECAQRAN